MKSVIKTAGFISALLFIFTVNTSNVSGAEKIAPSARKEISVTIYNKGSALIREVREVSIKVEDKPFELIYEGVPSTIVPTSLQVTSTSAGFRILDQNYEYDLINTKNLLDKYVGEELVVGIPDPEGKDRILMKTALLISNNDRPIFRIDDKIYIGSYSALFLAEIPGNLRPRPALVWLVRNTLDQDQQIEVSYLAQGLTWKADYVLKISGDDRSASLAGWVTLKNHSGMAFNDAGLKLVAGDIHRVMARRRFPTRTALRLEKAVTQEEMIREESFFEYHLYTVPRKISIKNNQTKQIALIQTPPFFITKILKVKNHNPFLYQGPWSGPSTKEHPRVILEFANSKKNRLGLPLPKGIVRAYKASSDGSLLLIGEDSIQHTPEGEKVSLHMGSAFDVTVERKQTDFAKLAKGLYESAWEIEIRNAKSAKANVVLEEFIPGIEWTLISNPQGFKKIASNWISLKVSVPAKGKKVIKYRVRVEY